MEDRSLELAAETLTVTVGDGEVLVDALFFFRQAGPLRDRVLTFPVAGPRGPSVGFEAVLEGPVPSEPLLVRPSAPGLLPAGDAAETFDIGLPGEALARHEGVLRVRYRQPGRGAFGYTLRTGAYWRGPIRRLDVVVEDPGRRASGVRLEGAARAPEAGGARYFVRLLDVEPREGLEMEVR